MRTASITQASLLRWMRSEDWLTLLLVTAAVLVVVRSVEVAEWVVTPSLSLMVVLGALVGLLAARIPWRAWQGHLVGSVAGVVAVYLQGTTLTEAEALIARMWELNSRLVAWSAALVGNDISTDSVPFAVILSALVWTGAYVSSWAIFKVGNVWLAILPTALGLLVNLTYLPERYYVYLFPYLLATMLLVTRLTSLQQQSALERQGIGYPSSLRTLWMVSALVFSSLILAIVFLLPASGIRNKTLSQVWNFSRQPAEWIRQEFGRLFSSVGSKKPGHSQRFGAVFPILPTMSTSDEPVFFGRVPFTVYWRVRAYTTYTSGGWVTDDTVVEPATFVPLEMEIDDPFIAAEYFSYGVEVASPTPYLYLPSATPYSMNMPARVETHEASPSWGDMITLRPEEWLKPGAEYAGTFLGPIYPESILRATDLEYPDWVRERYLQVPSSLPQRVRELALSLTQGAPHSYDKARAIEEYLRTTYSYGPSPSVPGFDEDSVDHFLFTSKTGHSDHFASAMATMLRAVGIPARLVSGYGPGVPDPEARVFTIRESDQHSWPEAFFPGIGWVEFEPSPIYDLRPRGLQDLIGFDTIVTEATPNQFLVGGLTFEEMFTMYYDDGEEGESWGGRLPGGRGLRPFPLAYIPSPLGAGGVLLGGLVALWATALWLGWRWLFLTLPSPEQAYFRLRRLAGFLVVAPGQGQTPLEFGRVLSNMLPTARGDITFICETFSRTRYGRARLSAREGFRVRLAWSRVQKAIMRDFLR